MSAIAPRFPADEDAFVHAAYQAVVLEIRYALQPYGFYLDSHDELSLGQRIKNILVRYDQGRIAEIAAYKKMAMDALNSSPRPYSCPSCPKCGALTNAMIVEHQPSCPAKL